MKIRIITPVCATNGQAHQLDTDPDTEVTNVFLVDYPPTVECRTDQAMAAPGVLARAIEAERDGCDAIVINCMDDPGLQPAREVVSIPVVGSAQASLHIAAMLGHRFSIIGTAERDAPSFEDMVRSYRLEGRLASVRWVDIPVLELGDAQRVYPALLQASIAAVGDGAHVIVPGCTLLGGFENRLIQDLTEHGTGGVVVVDPIRCAVRIAQTLVALNLSHSKRSYPRPGHENQAQLPEYLRAIA